METINFSLKEQLQELQKKLDNSQLQKQSEICTLNSQLAACKSELAKDAAEKESIKAEVEAFKGNFKYTVVHINFQYYFFYPLANGISATEHFFDPYHLVPKWQPYRKYNQGSLTISVLFRKF